MNDIKDISINNFDNIYTDIKQFDYNFYFYKMK